MGIPGSANLLLLGGGAQAYEIEQSLRFDGSSNLSWTPGSGADRDAWTMSVWVKRARQNAEEEIIATDNSNELAFDLSTNNVVNFEQYYAKYDAYSVTTEGAYRDPSAWYHFVITWDSNNSTVDDRRILWINGERIPSPTDVLGWNNPVPLGKDSPFYDSARTFYVGGQSTKYFQGYIAEFHAVNGTALDETSFGEYDDNGVWRPIQYSGSHGSEGFYLKFDPSATNGIGHDHSGNGNHFTASGFSTSGSGSDVFTDTPTTNESLFNFNQIRWGNGYSLSWGQNAWREFYGGSNGMGWGHFQTINGNSSGKYCWASKSYTEYIGACLHGVGKYPNSTNTSNGANVPYPRFQLQTNGNFGHTGLTATPSYTNPVASSQSSNPGYFYCWFAWDIDAGKLWVRSSSTDSFPGWSGDPAAGTGAQVTNLYPNPGEDWGHFIYQNALGGSFYGYSFSGNHFSNFVPDGFTYLNASAAGELAINNPGKHFKAVTYTGTSASNSITGVGFQPDLVWVKRRDSANSHALFDVVRGAGKRISSNESTAEIDNTANFTSFDSDGFSVASNGGETNLSGATYVAWCWKAGGAGVSNTAGTIPSTVSANPDAGFSIVTYDSNPTGTVGHGLGVAPDLVIEKKRDVAASWLVTTTVIDGSVDFLYLNATNGAGAAAITAPTSTIFTPNASSDSMVAYCFASVEGYSKFATYIGNGSTDGPYVYLGFKPSLLIIKRTNSTENWLMFDNARETYNPTDDAVWANLSNAESANYTPQDFTANGFKIRTSSTSTNGSGSTYMFMAFAESPTGGLGVSPATAR